MAAPLVFDSTRWDWMRPYVLGIVNATPDSFSDGGRHGTEDAAVAHGERLLEEGADAIDVGGESTRPDATPVDAAEEARRVVPVIRRLAARGAVVSVDTMKASVARAALDAGAQIVNDVSMGDAPEAMAEVAGARARAYIAMHSRGTPATMRGLASYVDPVAEVSRELLARARRLVEHGVPSDRLVLDPGIGFAKTADQSLTLLANIAKLRALGYAVCVGPSRKSFIDAHDAYAPAFAVRPGAADDRIGGTAAAVALAVAQGAEIVRVHDVAVMHQAVRIAHAITVRGGSHFAGGAP